MATLSVGGTTIFDGSALQSGAVLTSATFPVGHIIQTQFRGFSGQQVIGNGSNGTTFTNIGTGVSGQEFSIDMAVGSGNKVVGWGHVNMSGCSNTTTSARYTGMKIYADSDQIAMGNESGIRTRMTVASQNIGESSTMEQYVMMNSAFSFNYTPPSTNTITYTVRAGSANDNAAYVYINRIKADSSNTYVHVGYSSFMLMEVKG
jgi:hypothetical protein